MNLSMPVRTNSALILALGLLTGIAACKPSPKVADDTAPDTVASVDRAGQTDRAGNGDYLFDPPRLLSFSISIPATELEAMHSGSHRYGHCTLTEGGQSLADVGIRYKGNPAKEAATGKPDFNVEFNEFVSGQKFHGMRRLILLASRGDSSHLSAPIGWELFRNAGVPAARCGFAKVELNGRELGLYLIVEGVDRDFIRRYFPKSKGNLYDEGVHTDVDGKLEKYGEPNSTDQLDVDALATATKQVDPNLRWTELQRLLDVDRFLTYTALEVMLWLEDSYAIEGKKFRIYHDPATDRMVFFPKNVEEVFEKTDGPLVPDWRGLVARAVLTTPQGREQYHKTVAGLLETVFKPDSVTARARELAAVMRPAVIGTHADAAQKFDAAVEQFCDSVNRRASFIAAQLKTAPPSGGEEAKLIRDLPTTTTEH